MAPAALNRLVYVDDSGRPQSGLAVFGWVAFSPEHWRTVLGTWLDLRRRLWRDFGVPVTTELHATQFVNGRGRVSTRLPDHLVVDGVEQWKTAGREIAIECLRALSSTEGLSVGAVWCQEAPENWHTTKRDLYTRLIATIEAELASEDALALVFMDGDGSDPIYRATHRSLPLGKRRVIEDAIHLDSKASQLIQMSDLVAWVAQNAVDQHAGNEFAWHWYEEYLAIRDVHRAPRHMASVRTDREALRNSKTP